MARLLVLLVLLAVPAVAQDQAANRWHDTELADLRQRSRAVTLSLRISALSWFGPADPLTMARLLGDGGPLGLTHTPPVELATWIDHDSLDDPARRQAYREAQRKHLNTPSEVGWDDEAFERLAGFGVSARAPRDERIEQTRAGLSNAAFIGRVAELQNLLRYRVVLLEDIRLPDTRPRGVTLWNEVIAINVSRPADTPRWWHRFFPPPTAEHIFARQALETYVHELGHIFWFSLTDAERSAFEQRFWPQGDTPDGETVSRYARTNVLEDFAESFRIAVLYPTTYATEPVLGRDVLRPWTDTPMPASAIERVRHIDNLITAKTGRSSPTARLRDNRFSRMLESFAAPEDAKDEPTEFNLYESLNRSRDD
ncbi:MAG: hypothetical protein AAF937_09650 [Planctomycetota bacterium]